MDRIEPSREHSEPILSKSLSDNEQILRARFAKCSDIKFRGIKFRGEAKLVLVYVDGMVDTEMIISNVLKPLMYNGLPQGLGLIDSFAQMCEQQRFSILQTSSLAKISNIEENILKGNLAVIADGEDRALIADVSKFKTRAIEEPFNESGIRGPREGFSELLRTNTSLLRRVLTTPKLKFESVTLGTVSRTEIVIAYLEDIVSASVLNEVRKRVSKIQIDAVIDSGVVEECIENNRFSPFPQTLVTERPDVTAGSLLNGKVAILTDGSPCALVIPMTFWEGMHAPDDDYERFMYVTLVRWIRYVFALFSVLFPSIYIALTNFHMEMMPEKLMMTIAALRETSPFPTVIEVLMM